MKRIRKTPLPQQGELRSATQTQKKVGFREVTESLGWVTELDEALNRWEERRYGRRVSTAWTGFWLHSREHRKSQ